MINRYNYEIYALDYLEGRLSDQIKQEFELFLEQNPDIKNEILSLVDQPITHPTSQSFPDKFSLKKSSIQGLSYAEELIISDIEGIASPRQKSELKEITTSNKHYAQEYNIYQLTKLQPLQAHYPNKESLKKKVINFPTLAKNAIAYAALFILLFSITTLLKKPDKQILTSIQLAPKTEQIIFTLPADLSPLPNISRPINIAKTDKAKISKPLTTRQHAPVIAATRPIMRLASDTNSTYRIALKTFRINNSATYKINFSQQTKKKTLYTSLIDIKSQTKYKLSSWLEKQGIRLSRTELLIKIKSKSYGISVARQ